MSVQPKVFIPRVPHDDAWGVGPIAVGRVLGAMIVAARTRLEWTQDDLLHETRLTHGDLAAIERGERVARLGEVCQLADAFGWRYLDLLISVADRAGRNWLASDQPALIERRALTLHAEAVELETKQQILALIGRIIKLENAPQRTGARRARRDA